MQCAVVSEAVFNEMLLFLGVLSVKSCKRAGVKYAICIQIGIQPKIGFWKLSSKVRMTKETCQWRKKIKNDNILFKKLI